MTATPDYQIVESDGTTTLRDALEIAYRMGPQQFALALKGVMTTLNWSQGDLAGRVFGYYTVTGVNGQPVPRAKNLTQVSRWLRGTLPRQGSLHMIKAAVPGYMCNIHELLSETRRMFNPRKARVDPNLLSVLVDTRSRAHLTIDVITHPRIAYNLVKVLAELERQAALDPTPHWLIEGGSFDPTYTLPERRLDGTSLTPEALAHAATEVATR